MANETTIPALPCASINETLTFYVAMGFEITYQQSRPNNYGCVKYEDIDLHFFTLKGYEPKNSYSTCIVLVPDMVGLHMIFSANLRAHYGKLPIAGIPRISKLNNSNSDKQLRFNVIDPGGNWIRFIQKGEQPVQKAAEPQKDLQSKLLRVTQAADWLVEADGDFEAAAKMLDKALAREEPTPVVHRVQARVLRAVLAVSLDDKPLARKLVNEVHQLSLTEEEKSMLTDELQKLDELSLE